LVLFHTPQVATCICSFEGFRLSQESFNQAIVIIPTHIFEFKFNASSLQGSLFCTDLCIGLKKVGIPQVKELSP